MRLTTETLRLVIAGGGTGGHVLPAIATLQALKTRARVEALWIGSSAGLERDIATEHGIPFVSIPTGKLRRYVSLKTPVDAVRIPLGVLRALQHLRAFRPDVVFSTGGFVSVPSVIAARVLGIPSLTHEQTATIGLATRINARFCTTIALSFERSRDDLRAPGKRVVVTGNPVRPALFRGCATRGLRGLDMSTELPLVYVTGGAQGAHAINVVVEAALPEILTFCQVLHQCGPADANQDEPRLRLARERLPVTLRSRYVVREFIGEELPDIYAAAEVVVGRAGAGTVAELSALGKLAILIPLPGAGGDEQTLNAKVLVDAGAAILLPQSELTAPRLVAELRAVLSDGPLQTMSNVDHRANPRDAGELLADELISLAKQHHAGTRVS